MRFLRKLKMVVWQKILLLNLVGVLCATPVSAQSVQDSQGYWHYYWGHMAIGGLMMIAFWMGIIAFIVLAVRWFGKGSGNRGQLAEKSAIDLLNERFARGEIEKEEYEERKRVLSS